ncbi:uncharacterized protein LOC9661684 [Selaginella moellendorffii]|nr:uncharacterized protein LOC9661684 [Selaginella moellendorffii]|eukprot:XP_024543398.1 uncharacterized protein LOC9661684 [Selaginella moellendorffii]
MACWSLFSSLESRSHHHIALSSPEKPGLEALKLGPPSFASRRRKRQRQHGRIAAAVDVPGDLGRSEPRARLVGRASESYLLEETHRPLAEYMSLPASQYSVLDAQRIERVDDNTFKCYVHKLKFFAFEVCPVLVVTVEEQPDGCIIKLLSCTLEGSPIVVAQNQKFSASMENRVSWKNSGRSPKSRKLISDATIEVTIEVPFAFRAIPVQAIESTGNQVLGQVLRVMLPRFLSQLEKDYRAWASGDRSRRPLGTGQL